MKRHLLCLLSFVLLPTLSHSAVIYVKTGGTGTGASWSNAFGNLQDAIAASNAGDQIWIAQGVYTPPNTGDRLISFVLKPNVRIYGGFAGTETALTQRDSTLATRRTILSGEVQGDGTDNNNVYNVVSIKDLNEPVYLNSLVITKGYGEEIGGNSIPSESFGAAINVYYATAYLDHLEVTGNTAMWGGGMFIFESTVIANNIRVKQNKSKIFGGGIAIDYIAGQPEKKTFVSIKNADISENESISGTSFGIGGGIFARGRSNGSVNDTIILDNTKLKSNTAALYGGGAYLESATFLLSRLEITANKATDFFGGGLFFDGSGLRIAHDLLIANNTASGFNGIGAGIFASGPGKTRLINVTMANNTASVHADQIYADAEMYLQNCIIDSVSNGISDIGKHTHPDVPTKYVEFKNCLLGGHIPGYFINGGANIEGTSPGFVSSGNYQLSQTSPAIDAGNNSFRTVSYAGDLIGNPRIDNSIVDRGAYEFQSQGPNSVAVAKNDLRLDVFPNPANDFATIVFKSGPVPGKMNLRITDITGRTVRQATLILVNGRNSCPVDLSGLSGGMYHLVLETTASEHKIYAGRIVKR